MEAFASYFTSFIRVQTEDSSRTARPRCDTPRKVSTGTAFETNPAAQLRKLSISDGSCYPTSGIPPGAATPTAEGRPTNRASELDTTGTPVHLIARQLFDPPGGGPLETGAKSAAGSARTFDNLATEDIELKEAIGCSTPKHLPPQHNAANGGHPATPGNNENQTLSRCRNANEPVFSTPPRSSNNASRSAGGGNMLLSFSSTPIAGSRGKTTSHHGSSLRNGSLEVSNLSANSSTFGYGSHRQEASGLSDGTGRRSKTSLPCFGDFITAHTSTRPHRNRRSPFAGNASTTSNDPGGLNSPSVQKGPLFQDNDFPQLSMTPNSSKTSLSEQPDAGGSGKRSGTQRRRIAPTTVSRSVSGRHDFNSSSFLAENNLISIESQEDASHDPRGMLRHRKEEIRNDFQAEAAQNQRTVRAKQSLQTSFNHVDNATPAPELAASMLADELTQLESVTEGGTSAPRVILIIEFDKVTQKSTIDRLVAIYALLMDLNLVPNMLNELAYLINLVSTERYIAQDAQKFLEATTSAGTDNGPAAELSNVLRSPHNCVYFAAEVLHSQRTQLALLDSTSLRVVVENEQLGALHPTLNGFLRDMLGQKMKLENAFISQQGTGGGDLVPNSSITNVFYQQENDTKDHFPSSKEFNAFNKQRDLFYATLRTWETEHLNPAWEFETKLGTKVRAMLDILHHPINMSHLAKLFSAQLIISFNFDNSASELQMALPNIDLTKLSKLRQRLVAPSIFSTQYLFPGSQMFFRDFIVASENHQIFIEQLKAVLIHELLQMDSSTYDVFNISDGENSNRSEYVVRPETIATMRVLAKFIGFIVARPYQYEGCRNTLVENRQIELRNMLLPPFDVKPALIRAVTDRKLLITVPWLVQYLSMLDVVTLRLRYYEELFRMLHDIYKATAMCKMATSYDLFAIPTSKFIVRSCLDWLYDQSNVPEEYYHYSSDMFGSVAKEPSTHVQALAAVANQSLTARESKRSIEKPLVFNAILEHILSAACPFLADFRVSVMPSKVEKTLSRTGRYRHITTRYSGAPTSHQSGAASELPAALETSLDISAASGGHNLSKLSHGNVQQRLVEGFLQSQSQSMRRTVELIIDRSTSAVIKDFQMLYILPEKKNVNELIAGVDANTLEDTKRRIQSICDEALDRINNTWESNVPKMLNKRITKSFDALLPAETVDPVRKLCRNITLESPDKISANELNEFLELTNAFLDQPGLTTTPMMDRVLGLMILQLILLLIKSRCDLSLPELFQRAVKIWKHNKLAQFCVPPPSESDELPASPTSHERSLLYPAQIEQYRRKRMQRDANYIFSHVVSKRFIRMLEVNTVPKPHYDNYAEFITILLDAGIVTKDLLNDQFVTIFHEDWPQPTLDRVSTVIKRVLQKSGPSGRHGHNIDDSQSEMFLEMLSDIARDITDL
uniref:Codanin-1_C domain-containing protein n=1 Tax=Anopheles merus TaxID=30066 RepID=A0A182VFW2_ANOME